MVVIKLAAGLVALVFQEQAPESKPAPLPVGVSLVVDGVAAIVNDAVITKSELDTEFKNQIVRGRFANPAEASKQRVLVEMADQLLLAHAAKRLKVDERQIEEGVKQRIAKAEKEAGGPAALRSQIQSLGRTYDEWQKEQYDEELTRRLQDAELGHGIRPEREIVITPTMIRDAYRSDIETFRVGPTVKGEKILLSDARYGDREKALEKANELLRLIEKGRSFSDLARLYSDFNPAYGGAMDWIERRGLDKKTETFLFDSPTGAVSPPMEVEDGVAIVRVAGKRPAGIRPLSDPQTQLVITSKLRREQLEALLSALLLRLRSEAYLYPPSAFMR
jgi:parvulin-like peptidyl-prolyl isomerase